MTRPPDAPGWWPLLRAEAQPLLQRPLVWLTVALLLGIIWADGFRPPPLPVTLTCGAAVLLTACALGRAPRVASRLLLLCVFLLGGALHAGRVTPRAEVRALPTQLKLPELEARVCSVERRASWGQSVVLDLEPFVRGRAHCSLPAEPLVHGGDVLALEDVALDVPRPVGDGVTREDMARRGIHIGGRAETIAEVRAGQPWRAGLEERLERWRARLLDVLTRAMPGATPETYASLLASMVYGMRAAPVSDDIEALFRGSGTIHLLVASGSQVTIIAFSLIFLVRGTRRVLPLWGLAVVTLGLLVFALLAGLGASINRAVAMAVVLLGTFAWGRRYDLPTALAASALLLSLLDTGTVYDVGAQLTYGGTIGVCLALPPGLMAQRSGLRSVLLAAGLGSVGAWLLTTPVIIQHYNSLVLGGLLANLVAVPLAAVLLYLGLVAIGAGLVWLPLAVPLCAVARTLLDAMLWSNAFFASLPLAVLGPIHLWWPWFVLWYALAAALFLVLRSAPLRQRVLAVDGRWAVAGGVALLGAALLWGAAVQPPADRLRVHVLDVGAGQCVLVEAPAGKILIDAGADPIPGQAEEILRRRVVPFLALRHVRALEAIVISHAHEDHCNLAAPLMESVPTRRLLLGPSAGAEAGWLQMLQTARAEGITTETFVPGSRLRLGAHTWLEALGPSAAAPFRDDAVNNGSLVLRLAHQQTVMLFAGDIAAEGEERLLRYYPQPGALHADVLLAPHHGSGGSCTEAFLGAVSPRDVIVSCAGDDRRPPERTLQRFAKLGLQVWRTDVNGGVTVTSNGRTATVQGSARRRP